MALKELYKTAFMESIMKKYPHILEAIQKTRPDRYKMIEEPFSNVSMMGYGLGAAAEHHAIGAEKLLNGMTSIRKKISDVDTGLGAWAAGKDWDNKEVSNFRKWMFTDKAKENDVLHSVTPEGTELFHKAVFPSISRPIKAFTSSVAVPYLAYTKAMELVTPNPNQNPQAQYPQYPYKGG